VPYGLGAKPPPPAKLTIATTPEGKQYQTYISHNSSIYLTFVAKPLNFKLSHGPGKHLLIQLQLQNINTPYLTSASDETVDPEGRIIYRNRNKL
jgi:hypothetical protein